MTTEIVKIEQNEVLCPYEKLEQYVAIKSICDILGIDNSAQLTRIKQDEILNSVLKPLPATGFDGKTYDMACLPLRYIFGWLFTIDTDKVKPDVKDKVFKYKQLCYDALYDHFVGPTANRRNILLRKNEVELEILQLKEQILAEKNPLFEKLQALEKEKSELKKALPATDNALIGTQLKLFNHDNQN